VILTPRALLVELSVNSVHADQSVLLVVLLRTLLSFVSNCPLLGCKHTAAASKGKTGGGMVDGFLAMFSFREESFGDQVKFGLCLLFLLYLVVNYIRWQMICTRLANLEAQLSQVEALAQALLQARGAGAGVGVGPGFVGGLGSVAPGFARGGK
jgi:hypothetical protein